MKFENGAVWGFEHSIRAMRNPYDSWGRSDSGIGCVKDGEFILCEECNSVCDGENAFYKIGDADLTLMMSLIRGGSEHRKFLRQIFVSVDIIAPLYWWKQFSTYKIGVVENSCSTMHTLTKKPITMDSFETDDYNNSAFDGFEYNWDNLINCLEALRKLYIETKDKKYWKELIRMLPESFLQKRTITMNYENLRLMVKQRKSHKLVEWSYCFMEWAKSLPYAQELIFEW